MFTFFGRLVNEGYNGPISIFKITDIFFDTCNLFVTPTETDDGDRFDEEHNTMVTLVHKDSLKGNHAVAGTEEAVDTHNINLRSPRNSNEEDIIMKNSDEVSCSQQELCETLTQRSDKSGEVKTQSELDTIHAIQVSAPSEAKISSMGETQAHGASGENNWGRLHKKGSAPSDAEKFPMGENQAHGASGENNKTSQDESTELSMSKVSASPKEEKCLTGETEINGENRGKGTKKPRNVIRQNKVAWTLRTWERGDQTNSETAVDDSK
ncbi:Hypothetical predicted protein [Paramuricea clavata]|uniref:Uncharacterized protein n=1 Tax=Paramuricea clavata TaxID=317549 RepID=A0A6S7G1X5_PARCT|nr:Hypothetical predicted protein [Paramuricea clavata]